MFQFLMVRLKVPRIAASLLFSAVSIPYGTIKRESRVATALIDEEFQFLMVRLKDDSINLNLKR